MPTHGLSRRIERAWLAGYLLFVCFTLAHFVHNDWLATPWLVQGYLDDTSTAIWSNQYAPSAYRVLIRGFIRFVVQTLHVRNLPYIFAGIDFVASFAALYLLYRVVTDDLGDRVARRVLSIALFFALLIIPLQWVAPWKRPETLPTALFVAFSLFCLTKARNHAGWYVLYLAATVVQGFVRSDLAFIVALALVLVSVCVRSTEGLGPRRRNLFAGLLGMGLAGGVQALLQLVIFPHRSYPPGTPVIVLPLNLTAHMLTTALHALGVYIVFALFLLWKRPALKPIELLVLLTAALYLPLWFTVGVIHEVRIYVPVMFALSAVMAMILSRMIAEGETDPAAVQ